MAKVLILDSHSSFRELLKEEFLSDGYQVEAIGEVESLEEKIQTIEPDICLFDPYLDGRYWWGIPENIKQMNPHLPVLIFTACDEPRRDPRLSQAEGMIMKSVNFENLKKKVTEVLNWKLLESR